MCVFFCRKGGNLLGKIMKGCERSVSLTIFCTCRYISVCYLRFIARAKLCLDHGIVMRDFRHRSADITKCIDVFVHFSHLNSVNSLNQNENKHFSLNLAVPKRCNFFLPLLVCNKLINEFYIFPKLGFVFSCFRLVCVCVFSLFLSAKLVLAKRTFGNGSCFYSKNTCS